MRTIVAGLTVTTAILLSLAPIKSNPAIAAISAVSGVLGITNQVLQIVDYFQKGDEPKEKIDMSDTIEKLTQNMKVIADAQYDRLVANSQFMRLDDIRRKVDVGLVYLKRYLTSPADQRSNLENEFIESASEAFNACRDLPTVLELNVGDVVKINLLNFISEQYRCSSAIIENFQNFCLTLLMNGRMMELIYYRLKYDTSSEIILSDWEDDQTRLEELFSQLSVKCRSQFDMLIQEDIRNARGTNQLHDANKQRYNWLWNDVIFVHADVAEKEFYFEGVKDYYRSTKGTAYKKLVVFDDRSTLLDTSINDTVNNIVRWFHVSGTIESAEELAQIYKDHLHTAGLNTCAIGVTFHDWETSLETDVPGRRLVSKNYTINYQGSHIESEVVIYFYVRTDTCGEESDVSINHGSASVTSVWRASWLVITLCMIMSIQVSGNLF